MKYFHLFLLLVCCSFGLFAQQTNKDFKRLLFKNKELKPFLKESQKYRIQIIFTSIDQNGNLEPSKFFNYDPDFYFYPASTVKLPAALLAAEKLNHLNIPLSEPFFSQNLYDNYGGVNGEESVKSYIQKIFLVSDNDAFNRLYDLLGQEEFNQKMNAKGYTNSQFTHRLSISLSQEQNRKTPSVRLGEKYNQEEKIAKNLKKRPFTPIGKAYFAKGKKIETPMDFSTKNNFDLLDQQMVLASLFGFENEKAAFEIKKEDLTFIKKVMSAMPREYGYEEVNFPDNYGKFLMFGDRQGRIPDHIKIYNKIGAAYGFLIDNALIEDTKNNIRFLLSAVIYVNENETLNDDTYEYNEKGLPFLGELGRHIYEYQLKN
ncbi:serine hydrolase [Jiulongibacter sp. NS-SX5]|uniref:serine hydrolase n=1 Tax=Jiulongibacter sp. NS-SX5 TaxID=3463854 RepID=UPI00405A163C